MKKTFALIFIMSMMTALFCINAAAADPADLNGFNIVQYVIDETEATAMQGSPVIDGKIDDLWKTTAWYRSAPEGAWTNPDASEMYFYTAFMWDADNLYIIVYAVNDNELLYGGAGTRDRVSYYLDTINEDNTSFETGQGDMGAILYVYDEDEDGKYSDGDIEVTWRQTNPELDADALAENSNYVCSHGDDWWIIEAKFAVSSYNDKIKFTAGNVAGIDMTVRDHSDIADTKAVNFSTNWDAWENPDAYGSVTFIESNAAAVVEAPVEATPAPVEEAPSEATPAAETPAPATPAPVVTAPQTNDPVVISSLVAAVSALAVVFSRKKRII